MPFAAVAGGRACGRRRSPTSSMPGVVRRRQAVGQRAALLVHAHDHRAQRRALQADEVRRRPGAAPSARAAATPVRTTASSAPRARGSRRGGPVAKPIASSSPQVQPHASRVSTITRSRRRAQQRPARDTRARRRRSTRSASAADQLALEAATPAATAKDDGGERLEDGLERPQQPALAEDGGRAASAARRRRRGCRASTRLGLRHRSRIRVSLATAWARLVTSSLLKMLFMWFFTVNSLMCRMQPISGLVLPIATHTMIWRSRSDSARQAHDALLAPGCARHRAGASAPAAFGAGRSR